MTTTITHLPDTTVSKEKRIPSNLLIHGSVLAAGILAGVLWMRAHSKETLGPDLKPRTALIVGAPREIIHALRTDPRIQDFCHECHDVDDVEDVHGKPAVRAKDEIVEDAGYRSEDVEMHCRDNAVGHAVTVTLKGETGGETVDLCDLNPIRR